MADFKVDKKFFKKWVKALRSGEFNQTIHALRDENGFCCLGVVCVVKGRQTKKAFARYTEDKTGLRKNVYAGTWLLPNKEQIKLARLNDKGTPFKDIAKHIEDRYLKA